MFIKVKRYNVECLINVNKIERVFPQDDGEITGIRSEGDHYSWDIPYDRAQDALIDCAAQTAAPIATRIKSFENCVASLARSMEEWRDLATTPPTPFLDFDSMTPDEAKRFRETMKESGFSMAGIQHRMQPASTPPDLTKALERSTDRLSEACRLLSKIYLEATKGGDLQKLEEETIVAVGSFLAPGVRNPCDKE